VPRIRICMLIASQNRITATVRRLRGGRSALRSPAAELAWRVPSLIFRRRRPAAPVHWCGLVRVSLVKGHEVRGPCREGARG
jgi:hypothetical protein